MTDLATALRGAAARGELFAAYQPQLDPETDGSWAPRRSHFGATRSWASMPPIDFITAAEESGLIDEVGEAMLELGCAFAARIAGSGIQVSSTSRPCNSPPPTSGTGCGRSPRATACRCATSPSRSPSRDITGVAGAVEQLTRLRDEGVDVALDDFGTGYSSLRQLEALPFTELKMDQSLIRDDTDETWSNVARLVVLARHRGLRIVAEGIEDARPVRARARRGLRPRPGLLPRHAHARRRVRGVQRGAGPHAPAEARGTGAAGACGGGHPRPRGCRGLDPPRPARPARVGPRAADVLLR